MKVSNVKGLANHDDPESCVGTRKGVGEAKLKEVRKELRKRMHQRVGEVGKWLRSVVAGHNRYYGVPSNHGRCRRFAFRWWATGTGRCGDAARRAD
jgi:hypothetical protein